MNRQGSIIRLEGIGKSNSRHSILRLESLKNLGNLGSLSRQNSRRRISIAGFKDGVDNTGRDRGDSTVTGTTYDDSQSGADSTTDSTDRKSVV